MYNYPMPNQYPVGMNSPYINPQQTPQPLNQSSIIRVSGLEAAKIYQMPVNSMAVLFDNNEDRFYIKSTDGAGFANIRTFKFTEETNAATPAPEYINKSDLEEFRKEITDYVEQSISNAKSGTTKSITNVK